MINEERLRGIPLLSPLKSDELQELGRLCRELKVERGSFIICEDDPGPTLMFLAEGEAKATLLSEEGKEIVLALLGPGDFFGELAVLTGQDRSANVVATTPCVLFSLSAAEFQRHALMNPGLSLSMLRELATRLRAASTKIGELALYDVQDRVLRTLTALAKTAPSERTEGGVVHTVQKRPTHQELAAMVGATREGVTRALKSLEEEGAIQIDGKTITVLSCDNDE